MFQTTAIRLVESRVLALGVLTLTLLAASFLLAAQPALASTTFVVDSTADFGDQTPGDGKCDTGTIMLIGERCTLRAAIQEANATTGTDTINFNLPATQDPIITPASQLPAITHPVTINGYSQPGASPNTKAVGTDAVLKVVLSGSKFPTGDGLVLGASNSVVRGLVINGWYQGIRVDGSGATGTRIAGNYIGTDASGIQSLSNYVGIRFQNGSNNIVGGTTAAQRNVISGNRFSGISLGDGDLVQGNRVIGNYIGTDASGTEDLGNASYGVNIDDAPENTIGGTTASERNVISGNDKSGVIIFARGTRVTGNFIGTDATGTRDLGNSNQGVQIFWRSNTIGGTTAGERNVISGNDESGVRIDGADATGNKVAGNFIGTDKSGTKALGNSYDGVRLYDAPGNIVGGATAAGRNVISANKHQGVLIFGSGATGNKVSGNYLGTDASGTKALGNSYDGVNISAPKNIIGGTTAGERNVISANAFQGVSITDPIAAGNKVLGNYIGTDKNGVAVLGNSANGVFIAYSSTNTVGGATAAGRNVISDNDGSGVSIFGAVAMGNRVLSNSIFSNGGLGIDLGDDGPTANDPDDPDTGPNNLQNKPVLISAKKSATGTTTVKGTLNSTPDKTFNVQFFSSPEGGDEGKTFLGSMSVPTDGSGDASFTFSTKMAIKLAQNITATATGADGTSEFSAPKKVVVR